ncbi:MAG TPA: acyl-CoA dehydrogenase family protein [Syntrophales bacterium]|nr:acyl-CoA dehydrogenase family protein [Syntrophales bacterium]
MSFQYTEEQKKLKMRVRKFAEEKLAPIAPVVDTTLEISWDVVRFLAEEELFRFVVPVEYGGVGILPSNLAIIREELSRVCIQADDTFIMCAMGGIPLILFGTEGQRKKYLPRVATGEIIGSYSLTEETSGSDVASITTTAMLDGDHYVLNGKKCYASNGGGAEMCSVFAKTDPTLGGKGITAFVIDAKTPQPGLTTKIMNLVASHPGYEIIFDNYRVPKENVVGEPGKGMRIAMTTLDVCRCSVGAATVGIAQAAYEEALRFAQGRQAFGQPIAGFQAIQMKLADMVTNIQAARLLVSQSAEMTDINHPAKTLGRASMAKLFATEMASRVVDEAVQILGGSGLIAGCKIDRLYRAVRAPRIYEGTSEIQRLTIARSLLKGEIGTGE